MPLKDVIGQSFATGLLLSNIRNGRVAHAYLFHGPEGAGKEDAATAFAMALLCRTPLENADACGECAACRKVAPRDDAPDGIHPDLIRIRIGVGEFAVKTRISIDQIRRDVMDKLAYAPLEGNARVIIVHDADTLSLGGGGSANAFLKTLEEPPRNNYFILLAPSAAQTLDTIRSRCRIIPFAPLPSATIESALAKEFTLPPSDLRLAASLAGGSIEKARKIAAGNEEIELRSETLALWLKLRNGSDAGLDALERTVGRDGDDLSAMVSALFSFYRDLLFVKENLSEGGKALINLDFRKELDFLSERADKRNVLNFLEILTNVRKDIMVNVNAQAIIETLYFEARRLSVI